MNRPVTDARCIEAYNTYLEHKTIAAAGDVLGVNKATVWQLLRDGNKRGLFVYPLPTANPMTNEQFANCMQTGWTKQGIKREFRLDEAAYQQLLRTYERAPAKRITNLADAGAKLVKADLKARYDRIATDLGRHPIVSELAKLPGGPHLYQEISRAWGNFSAFRAAYSIEVEGGRHRPLVREQKRSEIIGTQDRHDAMLADLLDIVNGAGFPMTGFAAAELCRRWSARDGKPYEALSTTGNPLVPWRTIIDAAIAGGLIERRTWRDGNRLIVSNIVDQTDIIANMIRRRRPKNEAY